MPRESLLKLELVSIVLGSHCLQGSELSAVKFVKKTEVVVCALKFKSTSQGWQRVGEHIAGEKEARQEGDEKAGGN